MVYMSNGVGTLVPSNAMIKNGTEVPAPRVKNNKNGTKVPTPSVEKSNRTKVPVPMNMIGEQ